MAGNIKIAPCEIGWHSADWIHMAQDSYQWQVLENVVMHLQVS
jgi:hypothetical protein